MILRRDFYATVRIWVCGVKDLRCQAFQTFLNTLNPRGFTGGAARVARDGGAAWIPLSGCQRCGIHGVEDGGDEGGGESGEDGGEAFRGF